VDVGLFYFMANISVTLNFTSEQKEDFELFVTNKGSITILDDPMARNGYGALITISREDWEDIVKFVKRQQKNI
jgi:hypothetical protein